MIKACMLDFLRLERQNNLRLDMIGLWILCSMRNQENQKHNRTNKTKQHNTKQNKKQHRNSLLFTGQKFLGLVVPHICNLSILL